jgi:V/A-type H+-transporting ATPase subunit I
MCDQALAVLDEYAPEKTGLLSSLEGKELVDESRFDAIAEKEDKILDLVGDILSKSKEIAECKAGVLKNAATQEAMIPWLDLDVPMDFSGSEKTDVLIGSIAQLPNTDLVYQAIAEKAPQVEAYDVDAFFVDKNQTNLAVTCLKKDAAQIEDALRTIGFARPSQAVSKVPSEYVEDLKAESKQMQTRREQLEQEIISLAQQKETIRIAADYFRASADVTDVLGEMLQSEKTFLVQGYVPEKKAAQIAKTLEDRYDLIVETADIPEEEEAPILLENNGFSRSFEGVVGAYSLPGKKEVDPTFFMSLFYFFLFGIMLSDAAYGLIIFLACLIVVKKYPRMGEGMRNSLNMFKWCGLSTLIWGILFGGYFGDALDVIATTFFGKELTTSIIPPLWFAPLNDPMKMLIYSLLFGLIHMFVGLALKIYMDAQEKKFQNIIGTVALYALLVGLILLLLPTELFGSLYGSMIVFPSAVNTLAKVLTIVGLIGLVLFGAADTKNPLMRIGLGFYEVYNLTGWLSDILSYSRLLALGLATGVIAQVFNSMGSMVAEGVGGVFGVILFIVIFVIGHIFNLALNLLGAYVHTNRLQYVEFFGKFYEGGGVPFSPFKANTKYVDIKED